MGKKLSKLFGQKQIRILMLGLDAAGKTTILVCVSLKELWRYLMCGNLANERLQYKMKLGDYVQTIPTIGFNVETIKYKNVRFDCWDAGGQEKVHVECFFFFF